MRTFAVSSEGGLAAGSPSRRGIGDVYLRSPLDTGTAAGEYFTLKPDAEMPGDQRIDDAGSLTFDTRPLLEAEDYLGQPVLDLELSCSAETANLVARIVDVHPDGTATRVAFGVLNLAHRNGNAQPVPMEKNRKTRVTLVLDACGYRFRAGHRIRLSLSTSYWPIILPSPTDPGVTIDTASVSLSLPLLGDHREIVVPQPANPDPLPHYIEHSPSETRRTVERDMTKGLTHYRIYENTGLVEHPGTGNATQDIREETWTIAPDDPHSMTGASTWTCIARRGQQSLKTVSTSRLGCTQSEWITSARVEAFEGETKIFEKTFEKRIRRDFM